uniref:Bm575 n=1 Tax=Brugia malayi TaxID=6279 RepID=A0A0J9XXX3_BRUMA|nr:Bm575 [Brugia malayi]
MQLDLAHPINRILLLVTFKIAIRNFARKPSSIVCVAAQKK